MSISSLLLVLWACDDAVELDPGPTADAPSMPDAWPPPPPEQGQQLHVKGEPLAPGEETEMCVYIKLPADHDGVYSQIALTAAPGLHHSIISRINDKHKNESMPCFGFPPDLSSFDLPVPLFATSTQVERDGIRLPEGVGIELDKKQQLIVNYHYVNATSEPITPEIFLDFHEMAPEDYRSKAGFYSFTNFGDIAVPPMGTQKLTMTCPFPDPALLVTTTPHMHQMGTRFTVRRHDGEAPQEIVADYEGWYDPETTYFEPELLLGEGEGLTITCEWESDVDRTTYFGETSEHEMCFVFGYFYPATYDVIGVDDFGCVVEENVITPGD